jgi:hypothetical protein
MQSPRASRWGGESKCQGSGRLAPFRSSAGASIVHPLYVMLLNKEHERATVSVAHRPNEAISMRCMILGSAVLAGTLNVAAEQLPIPTHWGSERGSLTITNTSGNGLFSGSYESFEPPCFGSFHASGRVAENRVVFSVHFDKCGFLTIWNGTFERSKMIMQRISVSRDPVTGRRRLHRAREVLAHLSCARANPTCN